MKPPLRLCLLALLLLCLPVSAEFNDVSLNAATATGAGSWLTVNEETASGFTWRLKVTGSPSATSITLEGCIEPSRNDCDSNTIFTLDTSTTTTNEMRHIVNKDAKHLRCNLGTLTAGTNPTVTCRIYKGRKSP